MAEATGEKIPATYISEMNVLCIANGLLVKWVVEKEEKTILIQMTFRTTDELIKYMNENHFQFIPPSYVQPKYR